MKKRVINDKGIFLKRLGELLAHGYTLTEAIEFLFIGHNKANGALKQKILFQLQNGSSLSEALINIGLPLHVCSQIFFAERHGRISETLILAGEYILARQKDRQAFMKVSSYPVVLLAILAGVMVLLKTVLFPQFETLYASLGYSPDSTLRSFLLLVDLLPRLAASSMILLVLITALLFFRLRSFTPMKQVEFFLRFPVISHYIKLIHTQFFARELGYLLNSGMSINQALKEVESQSYRPLFKEAAERIRQELRIGRSFTEALETFRIFTDGLLEVIRHGERRGYLSEELLIYSQYCMETLEASGKKLMTFIQPAVFVFIGVFILLTYFSIMIPLFQVMQSLS